jgi:serine/threonine protein kinase
MMSNSLRKKYDNLPDLEAQRTHLEVLGARDGKPEEWRVGPYEIKDQIGQGGMATVYRAWHTGLHRHEALKIPRRGMDGVDTEFIHRLLTEARIAARLHHPHIVGIHNISEDGAPHPYFSMDLIEGRNLAETLAERGALPLEETLEILKQAASALSHAHGNGVVHRDIKPENILLQQKENSGENRWNAKVVDFGISRAGEDPHGTRLTRSGILVGTPEYMSPEQSGSGAPVDYRTDIYSLGIVAYEMLTGAPPFNAGDGVSRMSILISHVRDEAQPLHEINPQIPRVVSEVIGKSLAKNPDKRFASADEFSQALENAAPRIETAIGVLPAPLPAPHKSRGRWSGLLAAVTTGVFIGWLASTWVDRVAEDSIAARAKSPVVSVAFPKTSVALLVKNRRTLRRAIAFPTQIHKTSTLLNGERKVLRAGQSGLREVVLEITLRNNRELTRRALSTRVLKAPAPQIEWLGTRTRNIDNVPVRHISHAPSVPLNSVHRRTRRLRRSSGASSHSFDAASTPRGYSMPHITAPHSKPASNKGKTKKLKKPLKKHSSGRSSSRNTVLGTFRLPSAPTFDHSASHS